MVLKPCARPFKQPMVLLYMVQEGLADGFKTMQGLLNNPWFYCTWFRRLCTWFLNHVQGLLNNPWFYCTWFRRALQMVLRPCARPPKQPMIVGGPCIWF